MPVLSSYRNQSIELYSKLIDRFLYWTTLALNGLIFLNDIQWFNTRQWYRTTKKEFLSQFLSLYQIPLVLSKILFLDFFFSLENLWKLCINKGSSWQNNKSCYCHFPVCRFIFVCWRAGLSSSGIRIILTLTKASSLVDYKK